MIKSDPLTAERAFAINAINSPFVAPNSDGTESAIGEAHLWYIRQLRDPIDDSLARSYARLFSNIMKGKEVEGDRRDKLLLGYERYFARIRLIDELIQMEATIRQLVRVHLSRRVDHKMIKSCDLIAESHNIIGGILDLLDRLLEDECDGLLRLAVNNLRQSVSDHFLEPLIKLRNAIAHGNARSYVVRNRKALGKDEAGPSEQDSSEGRALAIYKNIDAVSCNVLCHNLRILHTMTYEWLVDFKPGHLAAVIIENVRHEKMLLEMGHPGIHFCSETMLQKAQKIANQQLRQACLSPRKAWKTFIDQSVS